MQAEKVSGNCSAVWIAPKPPMDSPAIMVFSRVRQ